MEDDLFDVFESSENQTNSKGDGSAAENKMAKVEKAKQQDAKARADQLLQELAAGLGTDGADENLQKRKAEDDDFTEQSLKREKANDEEGKEDLGSLESMPRIQVHEISTEEKCRHLATVPPGETLEPLVQSNEMVKEFPFALDPFQKEAILCLDNNQSVLVSAHTSAGKTVVALYAIARSLRDKQRVIYTTPIKALSNQKYRELEQEFGDVGLMTGDVTFNPEASCLVMTTEILRSMLYRGSEIVKEVGWLVFDEIHYMRDKERGVVWEETIILLPDNVHYVFLSATIPNAVQLAEWVTFLHRQTCHVVYTENRPVPLRHFILPAGGDGVHMVVDEQGVFKEENFCKAMAVLGDAGDAGRGPKRGRKGGGTSGDANVVKVIKMLKERNLTPAIVFSFSRKDCEAYASELDKMDFNDEDDKSMVKLIYDNAIASLSDDDKTLDQVTKILPLLLKGIGIHHSGLLPILKETVEILFGEGLIKALFATETFSMGLNMPARTVLFTAARKFDGKDYRWLSSGEYIQMSGRAGRRGLDARGIVILMVDQNLGPDIAKKIIKGSADPLNSQFRLTYNMILNLLRVDGINPEYMLERSFYQFQNYSSLPDLYKKVERTEKALSELSVPRELEMDGYHKMKQRVIKLNGEAHKFLIKPLYLVPFLQPGRLVYIRSATEDFGWGVVVNFRKKVNTDANPLKTESYYVVDVLIQINKPSTSGKPSGLQSVRACSVGEKGVMEVVPVMLDLIQKISSVRIYYPEDLRSLDNRMSVLKTIQEVEKRFEDGLPLLDPVEDMQIQDKEFKTIVKEISDLEERMMQHPIGSAPNLPQIIQAYETKLQADKDWKAAKQELKKAKSLLQMDELKCRKRVLRRLGYATDQDIVTKKGRVACEISAADELLLTDMMFNGAFNNLSVQQCAALLSCFVFQENAEAPNLSEELTGVLRQMQDTARRIAKVSIEAKVLSMDEEKYVESFRPHMMDVVHAWSSGKKFADLCKMTNIFEGSIIRAIRRLEELLREMVCAAKAIENKDLVDKFEDAIRRIKRDIIFAASLYL